MSQFKKKLTAFTAMLAFLSLSSTAVFADSFLGGNATTIKNSSNVDFKDSTNTKLNVNVNSAAHGAVGQVDWGKFNVGSGQEVFFGFNGLSQTIINRVLGGQQSSILGKLTSGCYGGGICSSYGETGKVVLINPAGILFGAGSQVDINSFTASTFDFRNSRNLSGMTDAQIQTYLDSLRDGTGTTVSGVDYSYNRNLHFNSNETGRFTAAGINMNNFAGKTKIELNGTTFDDFGSALNQNKTVNILADNIDYINSKITVGDNKNYGGVNSFGNVSLITADGVNFEYLVNGYTNSQTVDADTKSNVTRNIVMNNSGLGATDIAMKAGDIKIRNVSNANNSNIRISNSIIKGVKLENKENGDIYIRGSHDVDIVNSRLQTDNFVKNGAEVTANQNGGEIFIGAGKNATVNDSLLVTAGANSSATNAANAGNIRVYSYGGTAKVENGSRLIAKGDAKIIGSSDAAVSNSIIQASNTVDRSIAKNITVSAPNTITLTNATLHATGNIDIHATDSNDAASGTISISADTLGKSVIDSEKKLSIIGTNTTLDKAALSYNDIKFYNDGTTGTNNLTIKNNTTFAPQDKVTENGTTKWIVRNDVDIETNGNITLDNANLQRGITKIAFTRNSDGSLYDDKTVDAVSYQTSVTATANAVNLNVTSTQGNITAQSGTNVGATGNITLTADAAGKSTSLYNSTFDADGNLTLNAKGGSVNVKNNSKTLADGNVNFNAKNNITFGAKDASGVNIDNSSTIAAGQNVNVVTSDGNITAEKTTMPTISYGGRLKFEATKGSNNITSANSLKSVNVDYVAGVANNITSADDMQFVDSTLKAPRNNIEATNNGGDIILNNLEIKVATADAKETVTTIKAKGNVTTVDVTGTYNADHTATSHTYPNSVSATRTGTTDTTLDVNKTKLIVQTNATQTDAEPSIGSITLKLADTDKSAGVELTAVNNGGWDVQAKNSQLYNGYDQNGNSYGPVVTLKQGDSTPIAVSKIVTDKLVLGNTKIVASNVVLNGTEKAGYPAGTPSKGYIEVRDYMGFDQDNDFNKNPDKFTYTGDYVPGKRPTPDGEIDIYKKHIIDYGDTDGTFLLVYDRPANECPKVPVINDKTDIGIDDFENPINFIHIPRSQYEVSKTSKVSDNTVDQTTNIMAAAAKVDVAGEVEATFGNNNEDDETRK